jgi:hypothetical protein
VVWHERCFATQCGGVGFERRGERLFAHLKGAWRSRRGPASGSNRVKRGGSWNNNANNCRVANRNNNSPDNSNNNLGFRLVSTTHGKDALSHPRPPVPRAGGDEHGTSEGASTPTRTVSGERPGGLFFTAIQNRLNT